MSPINAAGRNFIAGGDDVESCDSDILAGPNEELLTSRPFLSEGNRTLEWEERGRSMGEEREYHVNLHTSSLLSSR
jgi:hypothetical protein